MGITDPEWLEKLKPGLAKEQAEHAANVAGKRNELMIQQGLPGVESAKTRETDDQALLVDIVSNRLGLVIWSVPNGYMAEPGAGVWRQAERELRQAGSEYYADWMAGLIARWRRKCHGHRKKLEAEGLLPGVPDLFMPYGRFDQAKLIELHQNISSFHVFDTDGGDAALRAFARRVESECVQHGLCLETKRTGEKPTQVQLDMHEFLRGQGYRVEVWHKGILDETIDMICEHCGVAQ